MKEEDILVGNDVYFIAGDGKLYPCHVIEYDSGDIVRPFLVSFGSNPDSAPRGAWWRLLKSDIGVGEDVVSKHYGELVTWARLEELQPLEKLSIKNNDAYPVYRLKEREEHPLMFKIGDIELGAAALSMAEPHKSGDINRNIGVTSPAKEDKGNDAVNHPSHYCQDGIECIDVIKATTKGMSAFDAFCQGNAMKYLFRWHFKNGVQDLKKARWYIDKLIEIQESSANKKKE